MYYLKNYGGNEGVNRQQIKQNACFQKDGFCLSLEKGAMITKIQVYFFKEVTLKDPNFF